LRADLIAVRILIAAVIVSAVVAIGAGRGADRRRPHRGAGYRPAIAAVSIAASRNCISTTGVSTAGNAVTAATNRSTPGMNGASVKAATPVTATTTPACERIIRHEAGAD
jgi:hypothetical protein